MAIVLPDRIKDSGLSIKNNVTSIRRTFVVADIEVNGDADPAVLWRAFTTAGIPIAGQPHPVIQFCVARDYDINPMSHNMAEIVVTYVYDGNTGGLYGMSPDYWVIDFEASVRQVVADEDRDQNPLLINYQPFKDKDGNVIDQIVQMPTYKPYKRLVFRRKWRTKHEGSVVSLEYPTVPEQLQNAILGKVNSDLFRGGEPHTWLCTDATGTTNDLGRSYDLTVVLDYKPETWDEWAVFRHPQTGQIPPGVNKNEQKGYKKFSKQYFEANFTQIFKTLVPDNRVTK